MIKEALEILAKYNQLPKGQVSEGIQDAVEKSFDQIGGIEFFQFTCPVINARLLRSENPATYICTDSDNNNFELGGRAQRLDKVFSALKNQGIGYRLNIILGDTDEDDYIFPVISKPEGFDPELADKRKDLYLKNFSTKIREQFPKWWFSVERCSEIESLYEGIQPDLPLLNSCYIQEGLNREIVQKRQTFEPNGYYNGLELPSDEQTRRIVELKFLAYARQGASLRKFFSNGILIQNEFPLALRTRMINLANEGTSQGPIPVFYPYAER